ncbi:hypothetical protein CDAR_313821 [Caerostris darwini]|uniref:Uncharacterized protein n=1 Tax=Caerostris darwini TaxID=1538125 RepID=A0AAV4N0Z5_9ARAC|nr:hypothetical protein CDAR_313821 [Caerostris darwini]
MREILAHHSSSVRFESISGEVGEAGSKASRRTTDGGSKVTTFSDDRYVRLRARATGLKLYLTLGQPLFLIQEGQYLPRQAVSSYRRLYEECQYARRPACVVPPAFLPPQK